MIKSRILVAVVLICALFALAGCGNKSAIVGEWQGTLTTMTFDKDGTVYTGILGFGTQGTYEFVDDNTIRITGLFGDSSTSTDYGVKISNNTLYLENSGITLTFEKVKK